MSDSFKLFCVAQLDGCELHVNPLRAELGYRTCMKCGNQLAKAESVRKQSMVQPINKSTPTYIADYTLLKQLNPKRTV